MNLKGSRPVSPGRAAEMFDGLADDQFAVIVDQQPSIITAGGIVNHEGAAPTGEDAFGEPSHSGGHILGDLELDPG
jgi:hypothetical protein